MTITKLHILVIVTLGNGIAYKFVASVALHARHSRYIPIAMGGLHQCMD